MSFVPSSDSPHRTFGVPDPADLVAHFYLLGELDYERAMALQRRVAYEAGDSLESRLVVLLCEHPALITVGRSGSRAHIRLTNEQLRRSGIKVQWVNRSGGCVPHALGQLAIYPILPLNLAGWSRGEYVRRLQTGVQTALQRLDILTTLHPKKFGLWGHSGLLAAVGITIHHGITSHGVFLNVHPPMTLFHHVDTAAKGTGHRTTMSSLLAERRRPVRMPGVRSQVVESLAEAFGCTHYHIHAAHPWLRKAERSVR
jgi:lipoyl(octanoyl) transferase